MYYVYVIYSVDFDRFYIGQTQDIHKRLLRHNAGLEFATKPFIPWIIKCSICKDTRSEAMILERKFKNLNRQRLMAFIEKYGMIN